MNIPLRTFAALLLAAATAPNAFAHYDTGEHPLPYATTGLDVFGPDDNSCGQVAVPLPSPYNGFAGPNCGPKGGVTDADRVSGWYISPGNPYVRFETGLVIPDLVPDVRPDELFPPSVEEAVCPTLTGATGGSPPPLPGDMQVVEPSTVSSTMGYTSPPPPPPPPPPANCLDEAVNNALTPVETGGDVGTVATAPLIVMECDLEAISSGGLLDETVVDGSPTGGLVPDGLWNDGGIGGACHMSGFYEDERYNTAGCDRYDQAFAEDMVMGEDVWIAAVCDWFMPVAASTTGLVDVGLSFGLCSVNVPFTGPPQSALDCAQQLDECSGLDVLAGDSSPCSYADFGSTLVCGADGVADDFDYGVGGGADGPSGIATALFPNAGDDSFLNCDAVAAAAVYVTSAVDVDWDGSAWSVRYVSLPTYGWIA